MCRRVASHVAADKLRTSTGDASHRNDRVTRYLRLVLPLKASAPSPYRAPGSGFEVPPGKSERRTEGQRERGEEMTKHDRLRPTARGSEISLAHGGKLFFVEQMHTPSALEPDRAPLLQLGKHA